MHDPHHYDFQHDTYLSGVPRHDELKDQPAARPEPLDPRDRAIGRLFIGFAAGVAFGAFATITYGHGMTTSERPAICRDLSAHDCVARVQDAR